MSQDTSQTPQPPSSAALQLADLWRYKLLVPAVALLVAGATAFWVVRQPKVYEAVANLEYDPNPSQPLGGSIDNGGSAYNYWDTQEFYETQNHILRSRTVAEKVVRRLSLHTDPNFMGPRVVKPGEAAPPPYTVEQAAMRLMGVISVDQVRDTRIVAVHVSNVDPDLAQLLANTVVESYIDKSLEDRLGTSVNALEWLRGQMQNLKSELENSEHALYKFRETHHSLSASLEERQKLIAGQLQNYSNALTELHGRRVEAEARLAMMKEQLSGDQDLLSVRVGPVGSDPLVLALREQFRDRSADLEKLTVVYGDAHPEVRAAQANLDSIRLQLRAQIDAIVAGVDSEMRELEHAEDGIQKALNSVNQQGLELSLQEIDYTRLERERVGKSDLYETVLKRAAETDLTRALRVANARVLDRAVRPTTPVSPRVQFTVFLGILAGTAMGLVAAFVAAKLDNKVRSTIDLEARGLTVLGLLPDVQAPSNSSRTRRGKQVATLHDRDLMVHVQPKSAVAECCRTLRTNITFQAAERPLRTIAITSAMPKEGKTTVSISLAIALAQSGRKVLLVDTDLRRPRVHRAFAITPVMGITSILAGEASLSETCEQTEVPGLTLLPCGPLPPNPSELLHTKRFAHLIEEMKGMFDIVLFDSPPLGAVTDPAIIATQVDGTLLVARSRSTTRVSLDAAIRQLRSVNARVLGGVLNGVNLNDLAYSAYQGYYRGYYGDDVGRPSSDSASQAG